MLVSLCAHLIFGFIVDLPSQIYVLKKGLKAKLSINILLFAVCLVTLSVMFAVIPFEGANDIADITAIFIGHIAMLVTLYLVGDKNALSK